VMWKALPVTRRDVLRSMRAQIQSTLLCKPPAQLNPPAPAQSAMHNPHAQVPKTTPGRIRPDYSSGRVWPCWPRRVLVDGIFPLCLLTSGFDDDCQSRPDRS
jgi:hypothetical protein